MVHARTRGVYVWDMTAPSGACGVAIRDSGALLAVAEALRAAPVGAEGIVREAILPVNTRQGYSYTEPIITGRHAADGTVVWTEAQA